MGGRTLPSRETPGRQVLPGTVTKQGQSNQCLPGGVGEGRGLLWGGVVRMNTRRRRGGGCTRVPV